MQCGDRLEAEFKARLHWSAQTDAAIEGRVAEILADVQARGDAAVLDKCMAHLARRGEIVLAGFYAEPLHFIFPPAFMREASIRIAAQWEPKDLASVLDLIENGKLSLDGLIIHRSSAGDASTAYETAFQNSSCLKMVLDWRNIQ